MHAAFGLDEVTRDLAFAGVTLEGGEGILFRATLRSGPARPAGAGTP